MRSMRTPLVVLVVLALVAGAVSWLWSSGDDAAPPPRPGEGGAQSRGTKEPPALERSAVPAPPPSAATPEPTGSRPRETPPPQPPAAAPTVIANVRDLSARTPVASFRWRFRNSLVTERGEGANGRAELALPASAVGELLIEADGYAPFTKPDLVVPTPPARAQSLDVFLVPAVTAAGITLHVRDLSLAPIAHVRVDAFALTAESARTAWHLGQALWARRTQAADGRYVLPELAAGQYGVRVVATKEDGTLLPLLPWRRTFTLTGDNGYLEDVPLEPGSLLVLELLDNTGAPFDPVRFGAATLSLRLPGGPAVQRKWLVRSGTSEASAIDVLPGAGKAELAEAVAPGPYSLEVFVNGEPRVQRTLMLRGGAVHEERVHVP